MYVTMSCQLFDRWMCIFTKQYFFFILVRSVKLLSVYYFIIITNCMKIFALLQFGWFLIHAGPQYSKNSTITYCGSVPSSGLSPFLNTISFTVPIEPLYSPQSGSKFRPAN
jgi:hypothetical protein